MSDLWVEVASELPQAPLAGVHPIVWSEACPISYAAVVGVVGAGFRSLMIGMAEPRRAAVEAAADRCFLAAWRWERAGAHHVLTESAEHTLWRRQLATFADALDAIESYSAPLPALPPLLGMTAEDALNFTEATSEAALDAAEAALLSSPVAPEPPVFEVIDGWVVRVGGAPQYVIDQGVAGLAGLRRLSAGLPPPRAPLPPAPLPERLDRALARTDLPPELRAQLEAIDVPAEPASFGAAYYRRVQDNESNDLVLRGRAWGELETEYVSALDALKGLLAP